MLHQKRTRSYLPSLRRSGGRVGDRLPQRHAIEARKHTDKSTRKLITTERVVLGLLLLLVVYFVILSFAIFASFRNEPDEDEWVDYTPEHEKMRLFPSNAAHSLPPGRVFVCITGQRQRLELHNKVKHILNPLRDSGWDVHVALAVSDDETIRFTNAEKQGKSFFSSYQEAHKYLLLNNYTVVTNQPLEQVSLDVIRKEYLQQLDKRRMHLEQRRERVKNHVRQFEVLTQCGKAMLSSSSFSSSSDMNYNLVVRVRDDVGLLEPLQVKNLINLLFASSLPPRTIVSSDCRRWHGMNDRLALVTPEAAFDYFMSPLIHIYTRPIHLNISNPETFIFYTYLNVGIHTVHSSYLRDVVKLNPFNNTKPDEEVVLEEVDDPECHGEDKHILFAPNKGTFRKDRFVYNEIELI